MRALNSVADLLLDLAELPPVRCNIADLNQVFLNVIVNAADAIADTGEPGTIGITTALDGDHVVISISDTGGGIPDDIRSKSSTPSSPPRTSAAAADKAYPWSAPSSRKATPAPSPSTPLPAPEPPSSSDSPSMGSPEL